MGKPMEWKHVDGSVTVGVSDRTFAYVAAEQDVNRQYFWPNGHEEYAVVFTLEGPTAEATWNVRRIGEPDAPVPAEVREAAAAAVEAFVETLNARAAQNDFEAIAGHVLEDTLQKVRGNWELDEDGQGAERRVGDYMVCVRTHWNRSWAAYGYNVYDPPADRFDLERRSLDYVLQAANEWIESR